MTDREKYLEDLIARTFLDDGQHTCPNNSYDVGCKKCKLKDLCHEADDIARRTGTAK